jgi:hypothetical protein
MGEPRQPSRVVTQLVAALRLLSDTPDSQRAWLADYLRQARAEEDSSVEELALQFEDAAQALAPFGLLREEQALAALQTHLSLLRDTRRAHLWTAAALAGSTEWAEVRRLAKGALVALEDSGLG